NWKWSRIRYRKTGFRFSSGWSHRQSPGPLRGRYVENQAQPHLLIWPTICAGHWKDQQRSSSHGGRERRAARAGQPGAAAQDKFRSTGGDRLGSVEKRENRFARRGRIFL